MEISIDGKIVNYHVQYSKGKKINLTISNEGLITLKVPKETSKEELEKIILKSKKVIINTLDKIDNRKVIRTKKEYVEEENFLLFGKIITLSEILSELEFDFNEDLLEENVKEEKIKEEKIKELLVKFYTNKTKEIIKKRVAFYEKIIGVKAKNIKVINSPSTWGTCNNKAELTFYYRLSMAPLDVIDYVVIHELCHIHHLNHDRSFWRKVGAYDINYKNKQDYLARLGPYMNI